MKLNVKVNSMRHVAKNAPEGSSGRLIMFELPLDVAETLIKKLKGDYNPEQFMTEDGVVWGTGWVSKAALPQLRRVEWPANVEISARYTGAVETTLSREGQEDRQVLALEFVVDGCAKATPFDGAEVEDGTLRVRKRRRNLTQAASNGGELGGNSLRSVLAAINSTKSGAGVTF